MAVILCRWINKELRLSQVVEPQSFARNFSNGYLIGEILHRYHLLTDFTVFVNDDNKSSKVNNFKHLKPTLQLLGTSFDGTTAHELMKEKKDVALHLIYELYIALEKKKRGSIGGTVADMIPNATSTNLRVKEQELYNERLHRGHWLNANVKLSEMSQHIQDEDQQLDCKSMLQSIHSAQQTNSPPVKDKIKRQMNRKTTIQAKKDLQKQQLHREKQAQALEKEIDQFEANNRKIFTSAISAKNEAESTQHFNSEYIQQIRLRLELDADTQKQKERRAANFLVEQSKTRKTEQDAQIMDSLERRLTRQTKEEERLVAPLLQIRSEKETLLKNNLIRQQQIQKRRERDFKEALEREADLARQEKLENAVEIEKELELCKKLSAEQNNYRYMKHFQNCKEIVGQIVDLATKAGDYRTLTGSLIPGKQMREWKELLFSGVPLYENSHEENKSFEIVECLKQDVLQHDYEEYKNMIGEWACPEPQKTEMAPPNSSIFNHVIVRLRSIVHPDSVKAFPSFSLKACVLGKSCSGKSTCLDKIAQAHGVYVLSTDKLVEEALSAYHNSEERSKQENIAKNAFTEDGQDLTEVFTNNKFTKLALLGESVNKVKGEGKAIPDELLMDIVTETVRQLPPDSAWVLDGFPVDITQAHLLEKALGGAVIEVDEVNGNHTNLVDPPLDPALDLALFLDVPDECVTSRTANQTDQESPIKNRIAAFEEAWPELEEWFGRKQNILVHVNADVGEEEIFKTVESILQKLPASNPRPLESSLKVNNLLPFVDEPLPLDIAASLSLHWDTVCESYVTKVKAVLQELRHQSTATEQHFFNYREKFKLYLNRTDPKHDLISQWLKDFNRIYLHKRKDQKAKLQQRLDDLLEELWDIGDTQRQENEQKIVAKKEDGWLLNCTDALLQHHSKLTQIEVEQFQDKLGILKTYYLSMCRLTMANSELQFQKESLLSKISDKEERVELTKPSHENRICDYEDALTSIHSLITSESQLFRREMPKDEKQTFFQGTDESYPTFNHNPDNEQADSLVSESTRGNTILSKIYHEYLAALNQAGDSAKVRLALIKYHGFEMVNALQSRADQVYNSLNTLVKEEFVEKMTSIEHVAEVVRHHIESYPILQSGLDLLSIISHQNVGNCPGTAPPSAIWSEYSNSVNNV